MMFYQEWAPNLPDIITHRAGLRKDRASKKTSFYIGGRVSAAKARRQPHPGAGGLEIPFVVSMPYEPSLA